jgi:hypothetical protein
MKFNTNPWKSMKTRKITMKFNEKQWEPTEINRNQCWHILGYPSMCYGSICWQEATPTETCIFVMCGSCAVHARVARQTVQHMLAYACICQNLLVFCMKCQHMLTYDEAFSNICSHMLVYARLYERVLW